MEFRCEHEELDFLRNTVERLIRASEAGRVTAYESFELDYAWDELERYVQDREEKKRCRCAH